MAASFSTKIISRLRASQIIGSHLIYLPETTSTQDVARREAAQGAAEGTLVIADAQTSGRGRFGRHWISPTNANIHMTVILRPGLNHLPALNIIAPVAVARAVEGVTDLVTCIKWPNDILVGERKLGGILIESEIIGNQVAYCLMGIGINVNMTVANYPEIASIATSISDEAGYDLSRELLLLSLIKELDELYLNEYRGEVPFDEWRSRLINLGQKVTVRFQESSQEGVAEDVSYNGDLILRLPDGKRINVSAGDVTLQR